VRIRKDRIDYLPATDAFRVLGVSTFAVILALHLSGAETIEEDLERHKDHENFGIS